MLTEQQAVERARRMAVDFFMAVPESNVELDLEQYRKEWNHAQNILRIRAAVEGGDYWEVFFTLDDQDIVVRLEGVDYVTRYSITLTEV